ncbi:hypothetical protein M3J09_004361 [Ascochyta lentis]
MGAETVKGVSAEIYLISLCGSDSTISGRRTSCLRTREGVTITLREL